MKNILVCCELFEPSVGGVQKVVKELSENFIKLGNNVTIATSRFNKKLPKIEIPKKNLKILRFNIKGNSVRGIVGEVEKYQEFILETKFDYIFIYAAQQWTFDTIIPIINRLKNRNIYFAPCGFSGLFNPRYLNYYRDIKLYLKKFNTNILHNSNYRDALFFKKKKINNKVLIPNAAGDEFFKVPSLDILKKLNIKKKEFNFLNVSNYKFAKGQDISIILFFLLFTKKKINFIFIGDHKSSKIYFLYLKFLRKVTEFFWKNKKIYFFEKLNRNEIVSAFFKCDLFLFTSRIECSPLVLYESSAAGLPFFSLDVGNAKEISKWMHSGKVYKNIFLLLRDLKWYLNNKLLLNKLKRNGRLNFKLKYNWQSISKEYLRIFKIKERKKNVY
jgi:glycosyltransferase involved in cell wall biosynthesis